MRFKHLTFLLFFFCALSVTGQKLSLSPISAGLDSSLGDARNFHQENLIPEISAPAALPSQLAAAPLRHQPLEQAQPVQAHPKALIPATNEADWTDWRDFMNVTISSEAEWAYSQMFGELPSSATMLIRDDRANPGRSQLCVPALFGEYELTGEYNPATTEVRWNAIQTTEYFPGMDASNSVPVLITFSNGNITTLNSKRIWTLSSFFAFICTSSSTPDMGYNCPITLTPETYVPSGFTVECPKLISTNDFSFSISDMFGAITEIKYAIAKEPNPNISLKAVRDNNSSVVPVYSMPMAQQGNKLTLSVTESGPYCIVFGGYDAEGEIISYKYQAINAELPEVGQWKNIGKGRYTDILCRDLLEGIIINRLNQAMYVPEWMNVDSWDVDIEESISTPGKYRIKNPYRGHYETFSYFASYGDEYGISVDETNDYYLIIHAEQPDNIWVEAMASGVSYYSGQNINFFNWNYNPYTIPQVAGSYATYNPGKYCSFDYNFNLILPGAYGCDFEMHSTFDAVYIDQFGANVKEVRYLITEAGSIDPDDAFTKITNGIGVTVTTPGPIDVSSMKLFTPYNIYAVSYNAAGESCINHQLNVTLTGQYYQPRESATWNDHLFGFEKYVDICVVSSQPTYEYVSSPYKNYSNLTLIPYEGYIGIEKLDETRWYLLEYTINFNGTEYTVTSAADFYMRHGGYSMDAVEDAGYIGTISNGEYRITGLVFCETAQQNWSWLTRDNVWLLRTSAFKDYTFKLEETEEGDVVINNWGSDISAIRYAALNAGISYDFELRDLLANPESHPGFTVATATHPGTLDLSLLDLPTEGEYVIGALSLNASGEAEYYQSISYTLYPPMKHLGIGSMNELFMSGIFSVPEVNIDFDVYCHENHPELYYLKDPYGTKWQDEVGFPAAMVAPGQHFIVVDAQNNEDVYITPSNSGLLYQGNPINIATKRGILVKDPDWTSAGTELLPGIKTENIISVPGSQLVININRDYYFPCGNDNSKTLRIVLPDTGGIENVAADAPAEAAKAEYFDLTGRRISHPAPGNIYIRRCGSTVSKITL